MAEKQQQWKEKENRKHLPSMLQKGFETYDDIIQTMDKLPEEWDAELQPLSIQAKQILDELAFKVVSIDAGKKKNSNSRKDSIINQMRTFFIHTLDALQQLADKINEDANHMTVEQKMKAKESIQVLSADLSHHQTMLDNKRKLDFDVLMDVIKARLKG